MKIACRRLPAIRGFVRRLTTPVPSAGATLLQSDITATIFHRQVRLGARPNAFDIDALIARVGSVT